MCPASSNGRVPWSDPLNTILQRVTPNSSTSTPTSIVTLKLKRGDQMKIMSRTNQALTTITEKSAFNRPSTPSWTDPAVIAKYALITKLMLFAGDRSIVSRSIWPSFGSDPVNFAYSGWKPPIENSNAPEPDHWMYIPRSPDTLTPAIFESRRLAKSMRYSGVMATNTSARMSVIGTSFVGTRTRSEPRTTTIGSGSARTTPSFISMNFACEPQPSSTIGPITNPPARGGKMSPTFSSSVGASATGLSGNSILSRMWSFIPDAQALQRETAIDREDAADPVEREPHPQVDRDREADADDEHERERVGRQDDDRGDAEVEDLELQHPTELDALHVLAVDLVGPLDLRWMNPPPVIGPALIRRPTASGQRGDTGSSNIAWCSVAPAGVITKPAPTTWTPTASPNFAATDVVISNAVNSRAGLRTTPIATSRSSTPGNENLTGRTAFSFPRPSPR